MRIFYVEYEMVCFDGLTGNQIFNECGCPKKYFVKRYIEAENEAIAMDEIEYGVLGYAKVPKYTTVTKIYEV